MATLFQLYCTLETSLTRDYCIYCLVHKKKTSMEISTITAWDQKLPRYLARSSMCWAAVRYVQKYYFSSTRRINKQFFFQLDGAHPHWKISLRDFINDPKCWIGCGHLGH